jgi:hypothetical protein
MILKWILKNVTQGSGSVQCGGTSELADDYALQSSSASYVVRRTDMAL